MRSTRPPVCLSGTLMLVGGVAISAAAISASEPKKLGLLAPSTPTHPINAPKPPAGGRTLDAPPCDPTDEAAMLGWIAGEYRNWPRATDAMAWSPYDCRAPFPTVPTSPIAASRSDDDATHGRKLYYLFARDLMSYLGTGPGLGPNAGSPTPIGQVLVKEGWHPVLRSDIQPDDRGFLPLPPDVDPAHIASMDGTWYERGEKADLFVMYRLARDTPGTDQGWVYGVVRPAGLSGPEVLASGLIESCINCHRWATSDRMLGMWAPAPRPK